MTVYVVIAHRPEHFAYGPYRTEARARELHGELAVVRRLDDIPIWTYAVAWKWVRDAGGNVIHDDGTPWTAADWDEEHPDTTAIDDRIWPRRLARM